MLCPLHTNAVAPSVFTAGAWLAQHRSVCACKTCAYKKEKSKQTNKQSPRPSPHHQEALHRVAHGHAIARQRRQQPALQLLLAELHQQPSTSNPSGPRQLLLAPAPVYWQPARANPRRHAKGPGAARRTLMMLALEYSCFCGKLRPSRSCQMSTSSLRRSKNLPFTATTVNSRRIECSCAIAGCAGSWSGMLAE